MSARPGSPSRSAAEAGSPAALVPRRANPLLLSVHRHGHWNVRRRLLAVAITHFSKGDRVRLTKDGVAHYLSNHAWLGTVATSNRGSAVRIDWDGNSVKTWTYVYHGFVELVDLSRHSAAEAE